MNDAFVAARADLARHLDSIDAEINTHRMRLTELGRERNEYAAKIEGMDAAASLLTPQMPPYQPKRRVQAAILPLFRHPPHYASRATISAATNLPEAVVGDCLSRLVRQGRLILRDHMYSLPTPSDTNTSALRAAE